MALPRGARDGDAALSVEAEAPFAELDRLLGASRRAPDEPYRGLEPLRFADAGILAAREAEVERLVRLVTMYRGVLLYGESGSGKSSVVNAGLLPRLVEDGLWPHRVRVQPREGAELAFEPIRAAGGTALPSAFEGEAPGESLVLAAEALPAAVASATELGRVVIVFDQFEELVTLFDDAPGAQARIVDTIVRLLRNDELRVKLLFAFREDYLASLEPLLAQQPELVDQSVRLVLPPVGRAAEIIRAPFDRVEHAGYRGLPAGLADRIAAELAVRSHGGALNLSELQVVCRRIWQDPDPAALLDSRGVDGLLEDFLNEQLKAFEGLHGDLAVVLLMRLVTSAGTRNVVSKPDLLGDAIEETGCDSIVAESTLRRLEHEAHLIRSEGRRDVVTFEIVSEFLVPLIALRKAERAGRAAEEELRAQLDAEAAERRRAQAQAKKNRDRLVLAIIGLALAGVTLCVGAFFWLQARDARASASSERWTSNSDAELAVDPNQSVLDALRALHSKRTPKAESAFREAVSLSRLRAVVPNDNATGTDWVTEAAMGGPGDRYVAYATPTGFRLWDWRRNVEVKRLTVHDWQSRVGFSADGRFLVGGGTGVALWNVEDCLASTGRDCTPVKRWASGESTNAAISPDGRWVATSTADGVQLRDLRCRAGCDRQATDSGRFGAVDGVAVTDAGAVAAAYVDGKVLVWADPSRPPRALRPQRPWQSAADVALSPDGTFLAATGDSSLDVWDLGRCEARRACPAAWAAKHPTWIGNVAFSPDGHRLVTADQDGVVRVFERTSPDPVQELRGHGDIVFGASFDPTGSHVVSASADGTARVWDVRAGTVLRGNTTGLADARFSRGPRRLVVTAGADGTARIFARTGKELAVLLVTAEADVLTPEERKAAGYAPGADRPVPASTPATWVMSADFSPDGRRVVTSDNQGHLRLWNVEQCIRRFVCTGGLVIGRRVADGNMNGVDFSPDGKLVGVAANWDGVELVDVASGKMWFQGPSEDGQILAVAFSADGDKLLAAGARGGVVVWDISSCHTTKAECTPTKKDVYHGTVVISLAVDPHNARVLTAGYDRIARLWKLSRLGRETPVRLEGHTGPIDSARFDDTGTRIVTAGLDGTIRVWDTASGDLLGVIRGHGGEVTRAEFAPGSSSTILSAGVDGTAQINTCECGSPGRLGDEMKAAEKREDGISRKPVPLIGR